MPLQWAPRMLVFILCSTLFCVENIGKDLYLSPNVKCPQMPFKFQGEERKCRRQHCSRQNRRQG